ncbi:hypothetical protein MRX96_025970 [Rhipicephalus microplus]
MVWCIVFGFCVFGVGWFAVDQHLPDLLPRVDVAVVTVVKHISSAATSFAIESKYAEDRRLEASPGSEATGGVENQAAGNQLKDGKFTMNIEESSDQLRREGAAAAIIQRWFHTEWKRWLRERTLSRPSIQTTPLDSQRCIDHDDGAFVSTVLEDSCVNVDALGPPESKLHSDTKVANLCSDPKVTFQKCLMEIARRGGNHVDSSQDIRCRQKLSHSSAEISRVLLRLEAGADPCASQSQVSKPA